MASDSSTRRFIPTRTGCAAPLGQLEQAVMAVVWAHPDPLTVGDTHAALPSQPKVAYTTVKTTMERLAAKGILVRVKAGKAYRYHAALTEEAMERRIVTETLDKLVEEFPQAVASFFVRPDPGVTEERLDLLREAIARRREEPPDG